jgi:hypothetical protein
MRSIAEIEKELQVVTSIDERNWGDVRGSKMPNIAKVFAVSSAKRRAMLERELQEAKAERAHELFGLRLHSPQFSPGTISLRVLAKISSVLNEAIEHSAWREWDVNGDRSAVDEGFRRLINLRLAGINAGSTELVFLGNTAPDLTGESALETGLKNIFGVLLAGNNDMPDRVNCIGQRATKSIMQLMKSFEAENIGVEFSWAGPEARFHWDGRPDQITRVRALLEEFGESKTSELKVSGVVCALSRKRILIETAEGEKLSARYHRANAEKVSELHLDQRCIFLVEETTYPSDKIGIKRAAYRLLDIEKDVRTARSGVHELEPHVSNVQDSSGGR